MYGVTRFLSRRVTTPSDAAIGALGTVTAGVTTALTAKMVDGLYKKTNHEVAHAFMTTPGAHVRPGWSSSSIHQKETYLSKMRLETAADRYTLVPKDDITEVLIVLAECHNLNESFTKKLKLIPRTGQGIVGHRVFNVDNGKLTASYLKYYIYKDDKDLFHINIASASALQEWQNKSESFTVETKSTFCGITWKADVQEIKSDGAVCLSEDQQQYLAAKFEREAIQKFAGDFPKPV